MPWHHCLGLASLPVWPPSLPVPGLLLLPLLLQDEVVELIHNREWKAARQRGDVLMAFIADASGSHTLEDVRR